MENRKSCNKEKAGLAPAGNSSARMNNFRISNGKSAIVCIWQYVFVIRVNNLTL